MSQDENELQPEVYTGTCCPAGRADWSEERRAKRHGLSGELSEQAIYELPESVLEKLDLKGRPIDYRHLDVTVGRVIDQRFKRGGDLSVDFKLNCSQLGRKVKASLDAGELLGLSMTTIEHINPKSAEITVEPVHIAVCPEGAREGTWIETKTDAKGERWKTRYAAASSENASNICSSPSLHFTVRRKVMASHETANLAPQSQGQSAASSAATSTSSSSSASMSTSSAASTVAAPAPVQPLVPAPAPAPMPQQPQQPQQAVPVPNEMKESKEEKKQQPQQQQQQQQYYGAPSYPPPPSYAYPPTPSSLASLGMSSAAASMSIPPSPSMYPLPPWQSQPYYQQPSYGYNPYQQQLQQHQPYGYGGYFQPMMYQSPYSFQSQPQVAAPTPLPSQSLSSTRAPAQTPPVSESSSVLESTNRLIKEQVALALEQELSARKQQDAPSRPVKGLSGISSIWTKDSGEAFPGRHELKSEEPTALMVKASKEFFDANSGVLEAIDETGMYVKERIPSNGNITIDRDAWPAVTQWETLKSLQFENEARVDHEYDTLLFGAEKSVPRMDLSTV